MSSFKKIILFTLIFVINNVVFAQKDSVIYVVDTVYNHKEIETFTYDAPIHYTCVSLHESMTFHSQDSHNHSQNTFSYSPSIHIEHSKNSLMYGIGITHTNITEYLYKDSSYIRFFSDKLFYKDSTFYTQGENNDTVWVPPVQYSLYKGDSVSVTDRNIGINTYKTIGIPIIFGKYLNHGYTRLIIKGSLIPTWFYNFENKEVKSGMSPENTFSIHGSISIGIGYWALNKVFLHGNIFFSENITKHKTLYKYGSYENNYGIQLGASYIFYDKIRE